MDKISMHVLNMLVLPLGLLSPEYRRANKRHETDETYT